MIEPRISTGVGVGFCTVGGISCEQLISVIACLSTRLNVPRTLASPMSTVTIAAT